MKTTTTFFLSLIISLFLVSVTEASVYIDQDFENPVFPPAGWQVTNTAGYNVVRTTYCSGYGTGVASAVVDFYDYSSGIFDLITPSFSAASGTDSVKFDHAYAPASNENDRLEIYTSTDNGTTWTLLIQLAGGASGPLHTASATFDLFVPTAAQWATKKYSLPAGTNRIKFSSITAFGNNLYLDNIRIGTPYTTDVGISAISEPKWGILPSTVSPKVLVKNYGSTAQTFQVGLTTSGYNGTLPVTLIPGGSQILTFGPVTYTQGNHSLTAFISDAADENSLNDTLVNNLVVTNNLRNTALEFCTGTWCQWCPCGEDQVHNFKAAYPNSVVLAYHGAGSDPWRTFNGNSIMSLMGFNAYPSGLIDRRLGNNNGWGSFFFDGEYRYSSSPEAPVSITPVSVNYNQTTGSLDVNLNSAALLNLNGQYKVSYIITEDNLVYPQTGNSWCPGNSAWVHDWIVRTVINTPSGDPVNSGGVWNSGQIYPLTVSTTIDPSWVGTNCEFHVIIFKENGGLTTSEIQQAITIPLGTTGINQTGTAVPEKFALSQNYPNPFNPVTNIKFSVPVSGNVSLKIYNILGKLVEIYVDGYLDAGNYNAEVDGTNLSSGIYFYTLSAKGFTETKKMNLIK
ncbi:MAG: Omp28-related outer membrane protein [Bacteroidetes bacterium]|nr:Omp28-related outer membrane protein [Bacteroidota bacterium]